MTAKSIDMNDWKRLYDVAERIRAIAPWGYLYEDQVFCVEVPKTGVLCFISVMGALGEHYSISVYTGIDEYRKLMEFKEGDTMKNQEKLIEINQIMLSYENKSTLAKEDIAVLRTLGLNYTGKRQWPMFRSFKDGFLPWFLEPEEVNVMGIVLEQCIEVLRRLESSFTLPNPDEHKFLVRYAEELDGTMSWDEKVKKIEFPGFALKIPEADDRLVKRINSLPATNYIYEFDYYLLLNPIRDNKSERPYYASIALLMDHKSGMILGSELFGMKSNYLRRMELVPAHLLKLLSKQKMRPKSIDVIQPALYEILKRVFGNVDIPVRLVDELPMIEKARAEFRAFY